MNLTTKATERSIFLCGKKLIRDCPFRWSSTFLSIKGVPEFKASLITVLEELEWDSMATSGWRIPKPLLQPFAQFTSEDFTTISSVYLAILEIKMHLEEVLV